MHALALTLDHPVAPLPRLNPRALESGLAALQQCLEACEHAGEETVGSYGLMACLSILDDCHARCTMARRHLASCAEIELTLLRHQLSECAEACDRCAKACLRYHDFSNWSACVAAGRECADVCRYLLLLLPTVFSRAG